MCTEMIMQACTRPHTHGQALLAGGCLHFTPTPQVEELGGGESPGDIKTIILVRGNLVTFQPLMEENPCIS